MFDTAQRLLALVVIVCATIVVGANLSSVVVKRIVKFFKDLINDGRW